MRCSPAKSLLLLPLALLLTLALLGIAPAGSEPEEAARTAAPEASRAAPSPMANYEPLRAGHPLRIIAYALHPVGVILDYAIFRPFYWIGSHEPLRTLFGHDG
jgi:hypothetical protein